MKKIYYMICVDTILYQRLMATNKGIWKFIAIMVITMGMFIDLITLVAIFDSYIFHFGVFNFQINIFSSSKLNILTTSFTFFFLPPLLLNYLLIFYNKKYEKLLELYPYQNGKLMKLYMLITYSFPFVLFFLAFIWLKVLGME